MKAFSRFFAKNKVITEVKGIGQTFLFYMVIEGIYSLSIGYLGKHHKKASASATMKKFNVKISSKTNFGSKHTPKNEKVRNCMIWTACGAQLSEITIYKPSEPQKSHNLWHVLHLSAVLSTFLPKLDILTNFSHP